MSCPSFPGCASEPLEVDSITGTAPDEEAYLILELPKPWPAKIKKIEGLVQRLRPVLKRHKAIDAKLLGTPEVEWLEPCSSPRALLVRWSRSGAVYQTFDATEEQLAQALTSPLPAEPFNCYLICTHGSRDPCCGLLGVPVYRKLAAEGSRRVLQVSHLGGHRYAPVVAVFPEWRFFGRLSPDEFLEMDQALAEKKAYRKGHRGSGRFDDYLQLIEAELWQQGRAPTELKKIGGEKGRPVVKATFSNGSVEVLVAEIEWHRHTGYKSCKDQRKGENSTIKQMLLKSLTPSTDAAATQR